MSDRVKLAREIAARTEPRFIEIKPEPRRKVRAIFIEVPRKRAGRKVPFSEEMRGGLTVEEYGRKMTRSLSQNKSVSHQRLSPI